MMRNVSLILFVIFFLVRCGTVTSPTEPTLDVLGQESSTTKESVQDRVDASIPKEKASIPESGPEPVKEASVEPRPESRPEPMKEASVESGPEPVKEARPEPIKEASVETRPEPRPESRPEPIKEARPDKPVCVKKKEVCDGLDNDCDGKVDESTCDDGNACNGVEVCDSKAKKCIPGKPKKCSDGNPCNGVETCSGGQCQPARRPVCPVAPPDGACKSPAGTGAKPVSGRLVAIANSKRFQLRDADQWKSNTAIIQRIAAHSSVTKVSLATVVGDLNRVGKKLSSVKYVPCYQVGFQWNSGDNGVKYWYPQGLTGSATAFPSGTYRNKKLLLASWYHKPLLDLSTSKNKGARLSLADVTNTSSIKYRLMLLVEPYMNGTRPDFRPIVLHAGGIVWYKNLLYVADTSKGLRVFDMNQIMKVQSGEKNSIGYSTSKKVYYGFNYKYVVPQVSAYNLCWSCCARFSFVAADLSSTPPALVTGEYTVSQYTARLHRWPLDPSTGRLNVTQGVVQANQVVFPSVRRMQGGLTIKGRYWISSSQPKSGSSPGSLYTATVGGKIATYTFPYPPEDLHYNPFTKRLWSLTENPNKRYVFGFPPAKVLNNCK